MKYIITTQKENTISTDWQSNDVMEGLTIVAELSDENLAMVLYGKLLEEFADDNHTHVKVHKVMEDTDVQEVVNAEAYNKYAHQDTFFI